MYSHLAPRAALALVLIIGFAACKDQALYDQDAADAGALFDVAPPLEATVTIDEPAPGGTYAVGATLAFSIGVTGFTLVEPTENAINERGKGHVRVTVDDVGGLELARVATPTFDVLIPPTAPAGAHELVVSLREKNGDPTGVEQRVAVFIEGGVLLDAGGAGGAGGADAGASDAGANDAGGPDAGAPDSGSLDAGGVDAGPLDAGPLDAGAWDGGADDVGVVDAGMGDAGAADSGADDAIAADGGGTDGGGNAADGGAPDGAPTDVGDAISP